ncbi:Uncharacterised protein [Mycobacteroides abscessus subsp. abscessus]|nr:Uncharacterised protein [Mycobacteroides abscessus subsp. abscessus]
MVWPGPISPKRIFSDSWSSISRWMVRRSGRAPSTGSKPRLASRFLAVGVSSIAMSLFFSCVATRPIIRSTISTICSLVSWWKTITSSMRLRNSGRKCFFSSSLTLSFIRS